MLEIKKHPPSGTIVLQRSERRNALSRELIAALRQAFDDFHQERSVRAVILTGAGDTFCSGLDLAEMRETSQSDDPLPRWHEDVVQYKDLVLTMLRFPKPIIAAVNGPALGAGAALALASDLIVAAPESCLGFPEPRRGIVSGLAGPLLVFRGGAAIASRLLLLPDPLPAERAEQWGLIHETVAGEMLWARAHELAQVVASCAAESIQLTKKLLNETIGDSLQTLLSSGAAVSATARTTEAAEEGVAAFLEKRPPQWPGG